MKLISHVSAILGPNPYTGKVESEQETVITEEKELNCNLENKARFKRRILHVPNLMQMRKIYCFRSFALDSVHVKCDV